MRSNKKQEGRGDLHSLLLPCIITTYYQSARTTHSAALSLFAAQLLAISTILLMSITQIREQTLGSGKDWQR